MQEMKGKLIDTLYRLSMVQSGKDADTEWLNSLRERADRMRAAIANES